MKRAETTYQPAGHGTVRPARAGFTLLEVLVALFIFTLLGGSVYLVIHSSVDAYEKGSVSMEVYQSVRVGMDRMLSDLRTAVSPESIWNNDLLTDEEYIDLSLEEGDEYAPQPWEQPRDIIFQGDGSTVRFVKKEILPRGERPFDLREIAYRIDREKSVLVKEIRDSVIRKRLNEYRAELTESETDYRAAHPEDFEWYGTGDQIIVTNNVMEMTLAYFDGKEWTDTWDSQMPLPEYDYSDLPEEEWPDEPKEIYGLPDAVAVCFVLTNGDVIFGITEIPARDLDLLLAVNETAFGRTEYRNRIADNRKHKIQPRYGERGRPGREGYREALGIGYDLRYEARMKALRSDEDGVRRSSGSYSGKFRRGDSEL